MPAMRSWKTSALAMMAQAIRRVWGTFSMPSKRAISRVMPGRPASTASRSLAAASMPSCSVSVAASTARCGTDTRRAKSARSSTAPSNHPLAGKRCTPAASSVKTQYSRPAAARAARRSAASPTSAG